jgi:hypothetical protein
MLLVNVCTGNVRDFLFWPYLLPPWISAQIYQVFLEEMLQELEEISLALRKNMWLQQDGAAAHFACQFRERITAT